MSVLDQLRQTFRPADAVDIAFVAVFIYAVFMWFKSSTSRQILIGMAILAAVYLMARAFDMYMTAGLFQAGVAFVAVAAIVVFQEDLRRGFVRLAALGRLPRLRNAEQQPDAGIDVLVEIAFELARKRVGGLLAIRGTEFLERHIRGGVPLDARISKALLDSIFDPHSMGHDGAVIVERDRIQQFAAHLPLSHNVEALGARGTRHSAALGLSEVSDALVVVVSEERGQVSVAHYGKLEAVATPTDLKRRLEAHFTRGQTTGANELRRQLLVENPGLKLVAVVLACAAWFIVSFEAETVQKTFVVSIEYRNLAETLDIDDSAPTEARVTLSGLERAFNLMAPSTLKVSLDIGKLDEGQHQIAIDESHLKLPSNLTLFRSTPRVISFGIHRWDKARLAVEARTEGRMLRGARLRDLTITPDTVAVFVWRSLRASTTKVYTETIDISRITGPAELRVKLLLPQYLKLDSDQPQEVRVKLDVVNERDDSTTAPAGGAGAGKPAPSE